MSHQHTLSELAELLNGALHGDGDLTVKSLASISNASADDLAYLDNRKFEKELEATKACCVLVDREIETPDSLNIIRVDQPLAAWAAILELFHPRRRLFDEVSPAAHIGSDVSIGEGVGIGPGAWIGDGASIEAQTEIYPGATVGPGVVIGEDSLVYPGAHIYHGCRIGKRAIIHSGAVIGADGYGFAQVPTGDPAEPVLHKKVQQVGNVVIEDDVEIGANTTIDRAALDTTLIARGTKIDNQVVIGHNVQTGRHCLLVAQAGIAGSARLGNYVTMAGQSGIGGHLEVGDGAIIGGKTGVMRSLEGGNVYLGIPALPAMTTKRIYAAMEKLPESRRKISQLEKRIAELERRLGDSSGEDS
jgi:UDP-3-O-[3-hydroxymyristoyl] glucosamine N-acyltransferase